MPIDFAIALPIVLWIALRLTFPAGPYEMDHGNGAAKGTFFPLLILYQVFFYVIAGLGLGGAFWNWNYDENMWPSMFLLAAAFYALLLNGLLLCWYEGYLHTRYPGPARIGVSNYTLNRYAANMALALSSLALFFAGAIWAAREMAK
jgi:hypothetical protein